MADFGAIVHWREPDNPVKDGALSGPFFSLQVGTLEKASTEKVEWGRTNLLVGVLLFSPNRSRDLTIGVELSLNCPPNPPDLMVPL